MSGINNLLDQYVGAGSYVIAGSEKKKLIAVLGTCVGVALYDRSVSMGGIIHLLLPKPPGGDWSWQPENFALTGLPLFINKLIEMGADKKKLKAVVAGGSLIGPLSGMDLALDIGGRTLETVLDILKINDIPIEQADTGGYYGARLVLNSTTWTAKIEPMLIFAEEREKIKRPTDKEIDKAIRETRPIPQVVLKIQRLTQDENYDMNVLAKEISHDQVICAKILRLCNSPLVGLKLPLSSLDQALICLGERQLFEFVLAAALESYYIQEPGGYSLRRGGLYHHTLGVAYMASMLAHYTNMVKPETAYTAGLLHDIGKVVLDLYLIRSAPLFYQNKDMAGKSLAAMERESLGTDHLEVGGRLAEQWDLNDSLKAAIRFHDQPENAGLHIDLACHIYLANVITSRFQAGLELETVNAEAFAEHLNRLGISSQTLPELIARIPWHQMAAL